MNQAGQLVAPRIKGEAVLVRRVAAADLPAVVAIDARVSKLAKPDYWDEVFQRFATSRLRQRFFLVAVAEARAPRAPRAPRVHGFIIGEVRAWEFGSEPCGWLFGLTVDPGARTRGVGELLMAEICARFRAAGVATVRTMVRRDNHLIMSFFRAEGMRAGPYIEMEMPLEA